MRFKKTIQYPFMTQRDFGTPFTRQVYINILCKLYNIDKVVLPVCK